MEQESFFQPKNLVRLFIIPTFIVLICVGIFLLFGLITYEKKSLSRYMTDVRVGGMHKRWQAAYELSRLLMQEKGKYDPMVVMGDLVSLFEQSTRDDPKVRRYLALSLGNLAKIHREALGDSFHSHPVVQKTVAALLTGLEDPDVDTQIYSIWALGALGSKEATGPLVQRLESPDGGIRKTAAYALGFLHDGAAILPLQKALRDSQDDVRWNAAFALAQYGDTSGRDIILFLLKNENLNALHDLSGQQKVQLKLNAIRGVQLLQLTEAKPSLETMARTEASEEVRRSAQAVLNSLH